MYIRCVLQYVRTTVLDMVSATKPPNAVCALDFGWKTSSWQTSANGRATVVTYLTCFITKKLGAGVDNKMNNFIQLIFSMLWPIQLPWLSVLANIDLTDIRWRLTFPWAKYILTYIG